MTITIEITKEMAFSLLFTGAMLLNYIHHKPSEFYLN